MIDYQIWLNGEYVLRSEAKIGMTDRGFRLGDVLFDTSRTYSGTVFRLREHLDRLFRSLKYARIDPGMSIDDMERITLEVVDANEDLRQKENDDYMITQIVTRGEGGSVVNPSTPNISIWIDPIAFDRYSPLYQEGAHAVIAKTRSYSSEQIDPKVKHYSRMNFVLAELEVADVDTNAFPLLLDMDGNLTESSGANFFIVTDGVLRTPGESSILQGVSRMTVIDLAKQLNIPVAQENLQPYDLYTADEAFLTSTPFSILPVGRVDNREVNDNVPGPVTTQLLAAWSELVGVDIIDQTAERARAYGQ
jgi:branched-chain amino acid aminotransferase